MPVTGATTRNDYTATSGQTVFAYTFEILDQADIKVFKNNTLLTLTTDYTVSGVGSDSGGNVTLTSGATLNDAVSIVLAMSITRTTNYQNAGDFLASDVNGDFDKAYISLNQLQTGLNRSIHLADSDPSVTMELPIKADRANNFLKFNSSGQVTTSNLDDLTVESLTVEKSDNAGEAVLRVHNSATTGDSDAVVRIDSSSNGESVVEFYHDGTKVAAVDSFTDGNPDLNITTFGDADSVIDMQPNDTRVARFKESQVLLSTETKVEYAADGTSSTLTVHNTGTGDADARVRIDSSDLGESDIQFVNDGAVGANIQWSAGGTPTLCLGTSTGTDNVIDMEPNNTQVARFKDDLITLSTQATSNISANGTAMEFKVGGSSCGKIYANVTSPAATITIGTDETGLKFLQTGGSYSISPASVDDGSATDDLVDLGTSSARFDDIYATNGTIQTSDQNEKQDIAQLSDAEQRVAVACKGLVRKFKWRSSVEENASEARYHFGVIAQDVQAAFAAEGLNAGDYGLFISGTWTDDEGVEQTRLGVRYTELLAFIISAL
jgi:hypothetical protein